MRMVSRPFVLNLGIEEYNEILNTETHHSHEIIKDEHGTLRWKEVPEVIELVDATGLNAIVEAFYEKGFTKNSEEWRALYRNIGYSLSGYWEIFYWEVNNEDASEYRKGL